jgi:hypothetical protein
MFQFFTQKNVYSVSKSNMGIYNFICGPRSYDAFPKWPERSFGLAQPGLNEVAMNLIRFCSLKRYRLPGDDGEITNDW